MAKNLLFAVFLWCTSYSYAQTIKTDVLVIGGTASGVAAAIQSARSKVKTVLIIPRVGIDMGFNIGLPDDILKNLPDVSNYKYTIQTNKYLSSGIWGEFRDRVRNFYKAIPNYDTTYNAPLSFEAYTGAAILKGMADTVRNLTVKVNTTFTTIKKDGTGWEVSTLVNGKTNIIKAKVVVDATYDGEVVTKAGAVMPPYFEPYKIRDDEFYRTSIAVGDYGIPSRTNPHADFATMKFGGYAIPMKHFVVGNADNLLITESVLPKLSRTGYFPIQLTIGQGVGCIAAYCAFFKTTTKNLLPRIIQQELLDFKGLLLPFADVKSSHKYIRAVQQIGATGLLKGKNKGSDLLFMPDTTIITAEIKPVLTEIYSRAFIWFDKEKPAEKFTVGNTLSLISEFTLTDPKTLQGTLQKDWQTKYGFTNFDTSRPITRLEFAVLVNQYLNPFARKIDLEGNIVN
ncbi:MAG: FAD-dependent oxidoreductase [Sphingobacteriaceae bacterium]|nr:MAG: FAD-dependent oxidoreductase [Sphingobacteriaceae bacterium]